MSDPVVAQDQASKNTHANGTCQHVAYRLTCEEYEDMWARAGGRCQLCRKTPEETPSGKLGIDHDHRIGFIGSARGILCQKCNVHVGWVERGKKTDPRVDAYLATPWYQTQPRRRPPDEETGDKT